LPDLARFNEILIDSVESAIAEVLSPSVLKSLYKLLQDHYDVTPDEIPYRLETVYKCLADVFGVKGSRTLERQIAKRLCSAYGVKFLDTPECTLAIYVDKVKNLTPPPNER